MRSVLEWLPTDEEVMGVKRDMDPREVLLDMELEDLTGRDLLAEEKPRQAPGRRRRQGGDEMELLEEFNRLLQAVEQDHHRRLRGIEINIRWLMVLVGGEVLAILGYAISSIAG